jgi:lipoprotein-releasing system permease protein
MSIPYELRIALRYLSARRKQAFISLISGISVLGVGLGVMALFVALGLMTGLQGEIHTRILGTTAHVFVFRSQGSIADYRPVLDRLRAIPGIAGAAPVIYGKGLAFSAGRSGFVTVKGIVPAWEATVTDLGGHVQDGRLDSLDRDAPVPAILLGCDLAAALGVSVGDAVTLMIPEGRLSPLGMLPMRARFRVGAIVRSGLYAFDSEWAYVSLREAQRLFDRGADRAGQVEVRLSDMYALDQAQERIASALGPDYVTDDWKHQNGRLFTALALEKIAIGLTIGLIVLVAAMNIVATLILMVMEKHKDVAILVAMGASRGAITRIFILQGAAIGAIGTGCGAGLGWLTCVVMDRYRLLRVPADVYQVAHVPFKLLAGDAIVVVVGALIICLLAAIPAARGAARLDPAEAIRYE